MAKKAAAPAVKPLTKTQLIANIAEQTDLSKKQVGAVFDALYSEIEKALEKKKGAGSLTLPGIAKIYRHTKPAQPPRKNVPVPFQPGVFKDMPGKPESDVIKIRALKTLKDQA